MFDRIRLSGLKLNYLKCILCKPEMTLLGHGISTHGVKPDPRKTSAIRNIPVPTTKVELQRFLGMVNYLGKFIPNLANHYSLFTRTVAEGCMFCNGKTAN